MEAFVPKKLLAIEEEIRKKHQAKNKLPIATTEGGNLKKLIIMIERAKPDEIPPLAYSLNKSEVISLAYYIGENVFNVDLANIIKCLTLRLNATVARAVYGGWQNNFSQDYMLPLFKELAANKEADAAFKEYTHLSAGDIAGWMEQRVVISGCMLAIGAKSAETVEKFYECLAAYKLDRNKALGLRMFAYFLRVCPKSVYMALGDSGLLEQVRKMTDQNQSAIMINMLKKMEIDELRQFNLLAEHYNRRLYNGQTDKTKEYLDGQDPELIRKFRMWVNAYIIQKGFKNDADPMRKIFWNRFADKYSASINERLDAVFMDFGKFYAVEFMSMGPIYFFRRDFFEHEVQTQIRRHLRAPEFKSWLYNYSESIERFMHMGDWQSRVGNRIYSLLRN